MEFHKKTFKKPGTESQESLSGAAYKRVGFAFLPKGACLSMAGYEQRVVTHGPQASGDAVNELFVISLGQVGTANRASKQHIAHKRQVLLGCVEHHMPRGVARTMPHFQGGCAYLYRVAVVQPA